MILGRGNAPPVPGGLFGGPPARGLFGRAIGNPGFQPVNDEEEEEHIDEEFEDIRLIDNKGYASLPIE